MTSDQASRFTMAAHFAKGSLDYPKYYGSLNFQRIDKTFKALCFVTNNNNYPCKVQLVYLMEHSFNQGNSNT